MRKKHTIVIDFVLFDVEILKGRVGEGSEWESHEKGESRGLLTAGEKLEYFGSKGW
jgi:hypothetical protein